MNENCYKKPPKGCRKNIHPLSPVLPNETKEKSDGSLTDCRYHIVLTGSVQVSVSRLFLHTVQNQFHWERMCHKRTVFGFPRRSC